MDRAEEADWYAPAIKHWIWLFVLVTALRFLTERMA
jgi:hypothetical protein